MDKTLTEQDVRKIVQEEIQKNYSSGSPKVPPHTHDGNNNLKVNLDYVVGSNPVPYGGINWIEGTEGISPGYASPGLLNSGGYEQFVLNNHTIATTNTVSYLLPISDPKSTNKKITSIIPIPIIYDPGDAQGNCIGFLAGGAPLGTMVLYQNSSGVFALEIMTGAGWASVLLSQE